MKNSKYFILRIWEMSGPPIEEIWPTEPQARESFETWVKEASDYHDLHGHWTFLKIEIEEIREVETLYFGEALSPC